MGLLDFSQFGNDKLGYQAQLQQANASLDEVIRNRALREKQAQEASFKNAEIAQKNQLLQRQLAKDTEDKARYDQTKSIEGTKAVLDRLGTGDEEGARALGSPYGITFDPEKEATPSQPDARPLPPEARAMIARQPSQEVSPEVADIMAPLPEIPVHGTGDAQEPVEGPKQHFNADTGEVSMTRMDPSTQGSMEMAPNETVAPPQPEAPAAPVRRPLTFHTPSGQTVSVDTERQRSGVRQRQAEDFLNAHLADADALFQSAAGKPPEVAARIRAEASQQRGDIRRLAAHIASGAVEPQNAGAQEELGVRQRSTQAAQSDLETRKERAAMDRTRVQAAATNARTLPAVGEPDRRDLARYQADVSEIKKNTLANADIKQLRSDREALSALADPNGPQFQLATDAMVKAATGGRVSVSLEKRYLTAMGLLDGAENWAYKNYPGHHGRNMPSVVAAFKKVATDASAELGRQLQSDADAFEEKAGVRSHWYQRPEMRAHVLDNRRAHYRALGLSPPADPEQTASPADDDEAFINDNQ